MICFYSWTFYHLLHSVKIILGLHFHMSLCDATILWCFVTEVTLLISFLDQIFACFRDVLYSWTFLSHVGQWYHSLIGSSCLRVVRRHMKIGSKNAIFTVQHMIKRFKNKAHRENTKIWSKNDISNVTFVTKHPRIVTPCKDIWRFDLRLIFTLSRPV